MGFARCLELPARIRFVSGHIGKGASMPPLPYSSPRWLDSAHHFKLEPLLISSHWLVVISQRRLKKPKCRVHLVLYAGPSPWTYPLELPPFHFVLACHRISFVFTVRLPVSSPEEAAFWFRISWKSTFDSTLLVINRSTPVRQHGWKMGL